MQVLFLGILNSLPGNAGIPARQRSHRQHCAVLSSLRSAFIKQGQRWGPSLRQQPAAHSDEFMIECSMHCASVREAIPWRRSIQASFRFVLAHKPFRFVRELAPFHAT